MTVKILVPISGGKDSQACRIHGYRDPRPRTPETEYMTRIDGKGATK